MIEFRHVRLVMRVGFVGAVLLLLNACSQSPAPVAEKPQPAANAFRSAQAPDPFIHPVPSGRISSSFANYIVKSRNRKHHGVDFAAPIGTPVYAASSGVVLIADMGSLSEAFGKAVMIEHGDKFQSLSAHLSRIDVKSGDWVQAGQQIGLVGKTGRATGAHLHFELWQNSVPKDPLLFLPIKAPGRAIAAEPLVPAIAPSLTAKLSVASPKPYAVKSKSSSKKSTKTASTKKAAAKQVKSPTKTAASSKTAKKASTKHSKVAATTKKAAGQQVKKANKTGQTTAKTSKSAVQVTDTKVPAKTTTNTKAKPTATVTAEKPISSANVTEVKALKGESGSSKPHN